MNNVRRLAGLLISVLVVRGAVAGETPSGIVLRHCTIEYSRKTLLGGSSQGILGTCLVQPGDRVKAGQVLGQLQSDEFKADVELKAAEANSNVGVRASEAKIAYLLEKVKTSEALFRRSFLSKDDLNVQKLEVETARMELETAKHQKTLAQIQLKRSQAINRAREFVSPHDGLVLEVFKNPGESVTGVNDPVFLIVNTDRLKVTGSLDVSDAWHVRVGQQVQLGADIAGVDLAVENEKFSGRIVFVNSQIHPETQTCKVVAEVDNRDDLLRGGLFGTIEIDSQVNMTPKSQKGPVDRNPAAVEAPPGEPRPVNGGEPPVRNLRSAIGASRPGNHILTQWPLSIDGKFPTLPPTPSLPDRSIAR